MSNAVNETNSWKITPPKKKNTWLLDFFHQCHFQHHSSEEVRPNGRPCWLRSNPDVGWKRRGCGPVVQLRSRKAPIDAEWRWPTRGLSCDFQLHQITKKEWRRDKESCWWKCVWAKKKDAFRRISSQVISFLDFRLPARWGSEAPLLVLWRDGLLDHCRIGTGCWSAWITGWFLFSNKNVSENLDRNTRLMV